MADSTSTTMKKSEFTFSVGSTGDQYADRFQTNAALLAMQSRMTQIEAEQAKTRKTLAATRKELIEARVTKNKLEASLASATNRAEAALAEVHVAQRKAAIARDLFMKNRDINMNDYDFVVELQQQLADKAKEEKALSERIAKLTTDGQRKDADILHRDNELSSLKSKQESLTAMLSDRKEAFEEQNQALATVDSLLQKSYADLKNSEALRQSTGKAKDDAEARLKNAALEIADLHRHLSQSQNTIEQLQSQGDGFEELERENATIQVELDAMRDDFSKRDHEITVKDNRIARLEAECQKALEGKLSAEAAASASIAPTEQPQMFASGDESLEAELADLSDSEFVDEASSLQQLEYSTIKEIASIAPIAASRSQLAFSSMESTTVAPIAQQVNSVFTQTAAPDTSTPSYGFTTSAIEVAPIEQKAPPFSFSHIYSTVDVSPVKHDTPAFGLSDIRPTSPIESDETSPKHTSSSASDTLRSSLSTTSISTIHEAAPLSPAFTQITPTPAALTFSTSQKQTGYKWLKILAVLLVLLFAWLWQQRQAELSRNGYGLYARNRYNRRGAFGNGRYLFGVFPIGFDIGQGYWSEKWCGWESHAIAKFENWLDIAPTPYY